jgi:hypothetical protein
MTEYDASVMPNQDWNEDGTADVTPQPPFPTIQTKNLSLENHPEGPLTVSRNNYPNGLVIIPGTSPPASQPAILPLELSSANELLIDIDYQDWPDGVVIWFTE